LIWQTALPSHWIYIRNVISRFVSLRIRQLERRKEDLAVAAQALAKARFKSKEEFEWKYRRRMRREVYKPGDLVLLRNCGERDEDEQED